MEADTAFLIVGQSSAGRRCPSGQTGARPPLRLGREDSEPTVPKGLNFQVGASLHGKEKSDALPKAQGCLQDPEEQGLRSLTFSLVPSF